MALHRHEIGLGGGQLGGERVVDRVAAAPHQLLRPLGLLVHEPLGLVEPLADLAHLAARLAVLGQELALLEPELQQRRPAAVERLVVPGFGMQDERVRRRLQLRAQLRHPLDQPGLLPLGVVQLGAQGGRPLEQQGALGVERDDPVAAAVGGERRLGLGQPGQSHLDLGPQRLGARLGEQQAAARHVGVDELAQGARRDQRLGMLEGHRDDVPVLAGLGLEVAREAPLRRVRGRHLLRRPGEELGIERLHPEPRHHLAREDRGAEDPDLRLHRLLGSDDWGMIWASPVSVR